MASFTLFPILYSEQTLLLYLSGYFTICNTINFEGVNTIGITRVSKKHSVGGRYLKRAKVDPATLSLETARVPERAEWICHCAHYTFIYIKATIQCLSTSFSSAPPPAIEISTPWEIIVRVSSASDLPRPWQLLGGSLHLHLFPLSGVFGLPSLGLWIPSWFGSVFV